MHRFRRIALIGVVIAATTASVALMTMVASSAPKADLLITPTGVSFGPVVAGTTAPAQQVTVTNEGSDPVTMDGTGGQLAAPFHATDNCQGNVVDPGDTCKMTYTFSPAGQGEFIATATGIWNGVKYTVKLDGSGVAPTFTISPVRIDFGATLLGVTSPQQVITVRNTGPTPTTMAGTGISVDNPFSVTETCTGQTLDPGKSCKMTLKYKPTDTGHDAFEMDGTWNGQAFAINMEGVGVTPTLLVTPNALNFGNVTSNTDAPTQTVTVTNLSIGSLVMDGTGGHLGAPFSVVDHCQGQTLKYGESCTMVFGFHPTALGKVTATATGTWNGATWKVKVSGTGV
jgi:Abnormal spindle-like microcephaly-assoc'd, ASPM-SPD-2-Hydin